MKETLIYKINHKIVSRDEWSSIRKEMMMNLGQKIIRIEEIKDYEHFFLLV